MVRESYHGGGREFPQPSCPALRLTPRPGRFTSGSFPGVKRPRFSVNHTHQSIAEVKERVELYLYFWTFVACVRVNFTFTSCVEIASCFPSVHQQRSASKQFVGFPRNLVYKFNFVHIHSVLNSQRTKYTSIDSTKHY